MSEHDRQEPTAEFVPLGKSRRISPAAPDPAMLASLRQHLDQFGERLSESERVALQELLGMSVRDLGIASLAAQPPEAVLDPGEVETLHRIEAEPAPTTAGLRPTLALIVKVTRLCNLRCTYCRSWAEGANQSMPFEILARAVRGALLAPGVEAVEFIWHGGETTLRPISFYRKALWLQQRWRRPGGRISNSIQTNATRLTPEWLDFLADHRFRVGVSLDGPPEVHDRRRFDTKGRPTSERVRQGLRQLQERGIHHGVLMVIDDDVMDLGAARLLDYLLEAGVSRAALLNVIPEGEPERVLPGDYLEFPRFVSFLRELFQAWWPTHADRITFREISDLIDQLRGDGGRFCVFGDNCMGGVLTVEPFGDVSICDRYQGDASYTLGNLAQVSLADLALAPGLVHARAETAAEMKATRDCPWHSVCRGGCPHDRYVRTHRGVTQDERCCGWAPLLEDLARAVGSNPRSTTGLKNDLQAVPQKGVVR